MTQLSTLIKSEIADFFAGFGGPGEPDIQSGEAQRLLTDRINRLLASEAQEPVELPKSVNNSIIAEQLEHILSDMTVTEHQRAIITCAVDRLNKNAERLQQASQPVAVPDDRSITAYFDTLALDTAREIMCDINRRSDLLGGDVQLLSRIQCRIDEACRADTLKVEPVSQPYTLPQWIPCSERMPEESGRYWCYVEEQNSLGKSHYQWNCSWNGNRWWVESENGGRVTHWQPLPSAPQEPTK